MGWSEHKCCKNKGNTETKLTVNGYKIEQVESSPYLNSIVTATGGTETVRITDMLQACAYFIPRLSFELEVTSSFLSDA